jgi:ribonuclease Z
MKKIMKPLILSFLVFSIASCQAMVESQVRRRLVDAQKHAATLLTSKSMHVILLGTGGPLSNEERDSSGIAVIAGGEFILVDVGPGIVKNMNLESLPAGRLSALFLTHFHSDHISDLGELNFMSWAQGRTKKLDVYGPKGVDQVVNGYTMAYALDSAYRTAHHTEEWMPSENSGMIPITLSIPNHEEPLPFFNRNGLKASVFQVDHSPVEPAVGYRLEYKGNVVVISGDTVKTKTLPKFAKNADLVLVEALNVEQVLTISRIAGELNNPILSRQMLDVTDYHMTPVQAAEVAQEAGARKLVLVHVVPPVTNFITRRMFMKGTDDAFDGEIILGKDGMEFELKPK